MITAINYAPSYLQGVYNPIIWSVTSNQIAQTNFSYVFDVYINGTFQIRLKVKPNPAGVGMVDVSQICQSFLPIDIVPETIIDNFSDLIFADNLNSSLHVFLKVGEEYGSPGVIYNGVTTGVEGSPAYNLYAKKGNEILDIPVHAWNSSLEFKEQQEGMSVFTATSGGYGALASRTIHYDWGLNVLVPLMDKAYPLTYSILNQKVYLKDVNVLSFINWTKYATLNDNYIAFCKIRYYNASGTLVNQYNASLDSLNGFNQKLNCSTVVTTQLNTRYDIVHVDSQLDHLMYYFNSKLSTGYTLSPNESMSIQMYTHQTANGCVPNIASTQEVRFTMLEDCETLYTRVRLSWLNDLGGRDYMNFTMFTEKEIQTTNDNYYQESMNWNLTTPVPMNVQNPNQNLSIKGGNVIYNKQASTSWMLNTDWLTQDEVNLLEGLQKSSHVLAYFNDNLYNQYAPYSVRIGQTSYKTKNIKQVKMVQGEFEIFLNQIQKIN
jgi:hypothetical protein